MKLSDKTGFSQYIPSFEFAQDLMVKWILYWGTTDLMFEKLRGGGKAEKHKGGKNHFF